MKNSLSSVKYPLLANGDDPSTWFELQRVSGSFEDYASLSYSAIPSRDSIDCATKALFVLPYPPSCNHFWASNGNRRFRTKEYKDFIDAVKRIVNGVKMEPGEYKVSVAQFRSDRRKIVDISNRIKALEDALTQAGLWEDDSLVADVRTYRGNGLAEIPCVVVSVRTIKKLTSMRLYYIRNYPKPEDVGVKSKKNAKSDKKKRVAD